VAGERLDPARTCLLLFDTLNGYLKTQNDGVHAEYAAPSRICDGCSMGRVPLA